MAWNPVTRCYHEKNDGAVPETDPSAYASIHLVDSWRLKRLYDELPDGDVGFEMIENELERRGEEGWC